jgi:hypothetical protein
MNVGTEPSRVGLQSVQKINIECQAVGAKGLFKQIGRDWYVNQLFEINRPISFFLLT